MAAVWIRIHWDWPCVAEILYTYLLTYLLTYLHTWCVVPHGPGTYLGPLGGNVFSGMSSQAFVVAFL